MADPWQVLGIAPTRDEAVIRRAYADRLKTTRPDLDPAGFRVLRAAFEAARAGAPFQPAPVSPADEGTVPAEILGHLRAGRWLDAATAWRRAVDASEISFDAQDRLEIALANAVLADKAISPEQLNTIIARMFWERTGGEFRAPEAVVEVMRRRAALRWLGEMRAAAGERWAWRGARRRRRVAARLLLRGPPGPVARRFPYILSQPDFAHWLAELPPHRRFLPDCPDPNRIAWCMLSQRRLDAVLLRMFWRLNLVTLFTPAVFLVQVARALLRTMFGG